MAKILEQGRGFVILYKEAGEDSEKTAPSGMGVLYRLDMPVAGLIAAAKSGSEFEILSKRYFLICAGKLENNTGTMEDFLYHDPRSNRTFPVKKMRKGVKEAKLSYEVLGYDAKEDLSFVSAVLDTGRTHQIRVHMSYIGHPLLGDNLYGKEIPDSHGMTRAALHAAHLEFKQPITGEELAFDADLPPDMAGLI